MVAEIPNRLIFIWFGPRLSYSHYLAVGSAVQCCRPEETLLLVDGLDETDPISKRILALPSVRVVRGPRDVVRDVPARGRALAEVFDDLGKPEAKANLVRLAALQRWGGVYLDFDTLTVKDLAVLRRAHRGFCGLEHLTEPASAASQPPLVREPVRWLRQRYRAWCARRPNGVAAFRRAAFLYPRAVNNAVLGSVPDSPALDQLLDRALALPRELRGRRFVLGTHLLQQVTRNRSTPDFTVLDPGYFYPLGPKLSGHWFRPGSAARVDEYLTPQTAVVHWYASNERDVGGIDVRWIEENRGSVAFAALVDRVTGSLPGHFGDELADHL